MDALILAAGMGTRIRDISPIKPLTLLGGRPLIEWSVEALAGAGCTRVVVVTGYAAETVEAELIRISKTTGIPVEPVRLDNYARPNGFSVCAGAERIEGHYLLTMADHILSVKTLEALVRQNRADCGVILAVDKRTNGAHVDPGDATWVRSDGSGNIVAIGKHIVEFDAVDCGAFLASPELSHAIGAAISAGRPGSLSDGMQVLADARRAKVMDIGSAWWIDVDDAASHAMAERTLALHTETLTHAPRVAGAVRC